VRKRRKRQAPKSEVRASEFLSFSFSSNLPLHSRAPRPTPPPRLIRTSIKWGHQVATMFLFIKLLFNFRFLFV